MADSVEQKTLGVIAEEFGVPVADLDRDTVADDVDGWDSLRHIKLILKLEAAFGTEFDLDALSCVDNVGGLIDLIAKGSAK